MVNTFLRMEKASATIIEARDVPTVWKYRKIVLFQFDKHAKYKFWICASPTFHISICCLHFSNTKNNSYYNIHSKNEMHTLNLLVLEKWKTSQPYNVSFLLYSNFSVQIDSSAFLFSAIRCICWVNHIYIELCTNIE